MATTWPAPGPIIARDLNAALLSGSVAPVFCSNVAASWAVRSTVASSEAVASGVTLCLDAPVSNPNRSYCTSIRPTAWST